MKYFKLSVFQLIGSRRIESELHINPSMVSVQRMLAEINDYPTTVIHLGGERYYCHTPVEIVLRGLQDVDRINKSIVHAN